jgi:2-oxoglutarate ferredoxin oxidoreductase subunit delta
MPQILIDQNRCKACALCVEACPQGVLAMGTTLNAHGYIFAQASRPTRCLGCRLCCLACPDSAIQMRASGVIYECFPY